MHLLEYGAKGPQVRSLQRLLADNRFGHFHPGPVDGEFGPRTASACQRAKRMLGYRLSDIKPVAGDALSAYLAGARKLTPAMRVRRAARLAREKKAEAAGSRQDQMRKRVLARIKGELGTTEAGGHSNVIKYNTWWGWGAVAYCAIGVSWAWCMEGSKTFARGSRWAGTDAMLADAKAGHYGLTLTNDPKPGDPGVIDFDGHSDPDHCLTFLEDSGGGMCKTVEFNHLGPNGKEGVFYGERPMRNCWWFKVGK